MLYVFHGDVCMGISHGAAVGNMYFNIVVRNVCGTHTVPYNTET